MTLTVPCTKCGAAIPFEAVAQDDAYCPACKGKRPQREYLTNLASRVYSTPDGFARLSADEKTFFALTCVIGVAYPNGFTQFFAGPSGGFYAYAIDGLEEIGAEYAARQLARAKQLLFGDAIVPLDQSQRVRQIDRFGSAAALKVLEQDFSTSHEDVVARSQMFGVTKGLFGKR